MTGRCDGHRGKRAFGTWAQALIAAKRMRQNNDEPYEPYKCVCSKIFVGAVIKNKKTRKRPYVRQPKIT